MYIGLLYVTLITHVNLVVLGKYQFFNGRNFTDIETIVSCTRLTAKRLFNPDRRIDVIQFKPVDDLDNAISKAYAISGPTLITNRITRIKNERIPSYIVIEHDQFVNSRKLFLFGISSLHTLQYLFVTKNDREQINLFARDMLNAGYRDVAFLMFDNAVIGTIIRANSTGNEITLRSVGFCTSRTNDVDRISPFAADSQRFCPLGGCTIKYGIVTDDTMSFWRKEDTLKLKHNETLKAVGGLLVEEFGMRYNLTIDSSTGINIPWPDAFRKLSNREIDIVAGPKPEDLQILNNVEVICWYMFRDMVFASLVRSRTVENDITKLVMPFHYVVWICVSLVFLVYVMLLIMLRRLSDMGLIKERVKFAHICAISLSQGVTLPRNFGLRLVLLLWIMFALYLNIIYNSTFTSSLANVETEDLLEDLEQVRDSGQPLGGPSRVRSYFNNSDDQFIRDLYERYEIMSPDEALDCIFTRNGFAVLQHFTVDRMNWDYRSNRNLRMYTLPQPVFRFPVFFFARKGYMYRRPLRRFVTKYREAGIIGKLDNVLIIEEDKQIALSETSDEILTMKHVRPIFEIFFICQGIGCTILFIELLVARFLKSSSQLNSTSINGLIAK